MLYPKTPFVSFARYLAFFASVEMSGGDLTVVVTGFESKAGAVRMAVFESEEAFESDGEIKLI